MFRPGHFGTGTGPITRAIAEKARPDCQVIVIERDADFARLLRERFGSHPNFEVVEGDARDLCPEPGGSWDQTG